MDIGAIAQLTKGKKGDKGAGQHKGKTNEPPLATAWPLDQQQKEASFSSDSLT